MIDRQGRVGRVTAASGGEAGFRTIRVSLLAAVVGLAAGVLAFLLLRLIGLIGNLVFFGSFSGIIRPFDLSHVGAWVIIIPALGGLVVGLMAKYGTNAIKGHGIPEAMEAVLTRQSRIPAKVAVYKPIATAIAIGTGGPFGAEGPIIQTGGAIGSLIGQAIRTTPAERKVLLACGAAAGMAATFGTPLAGVVLSIELLLFEFASRSFVPLVIASTLATSMHMLLLGTGPLFDMVPVDFGIPRNLPWYVLLGIICGLAAVGYTHLLYWAEDRFESLRVPKVLLPAIGGLGLGIIGLFAPQVLGVGYKTITAVLNNDLAVTALIVIMIAKSAALIVSLSSGTSGGLLAPMFMASAALGAVFAYAVGLIPGTDAAPGAFALAAMGAVFGAASRATFTFILFGFEITRDYNAILPLMLVGVIADIVTLRLLKTTIQTEKLARRGLKVPSDFSADPMHQVSVGEAMDPQPPTLLGATLLVDVADRLARGDTSLQRHLGILLVDEEGKLQGILTRSDIQRGLAREDGKTITAIQAGSRDLKVAYPDDTLHQASTTMLRFDIGRLAVVSRDDPGKLLGYLGRDELLSVRRRWLDEETNRQVGWLSRKRTEPEPASGRGTDQALGPGAEQRAGRARTRATEQAPRLDTEPEPEPPSRG